MSIAGQEVFYTEYLAAKADVDASTNAAGVLSGKLNTVSIGTIGPNFRSAIAGVTAASLQAEIQKVVDAKVADANTALAAGITIPSLFGITGTIEVNPQPGYIEAGVDAVPETFEQIKNIMIAIADELRYARKVNKLEALKASWGAAQW